jgi:hypothetical protein
MTWVSALSSQDVQRMSPSGRNAGNTQSSSDLGQQRVAHSDADALRAIAHIQHERSAFDVGLVPQVTTRGIEVGVLAGAATSSVSAACRRLFELCTPLSR